jgi:hypothetical protein
VYEYLCLYCVSKKTVKCDQHLPDSGQIGVPNSRVSRFSQSKGDCEVTSSQQSWGDQEMVDRSTTPSSPERESGELFGGGDADANKRGNHRKKARRDGRKEGIPRWLDPGGGVIGGQGAEPEGGRAGEGEGKIQIL